MTSDFDDVMELAQAGPIGVAVSGGGDSVAALVMVLDWAQSRDREVFAVTVNHGLRAEAAQEANDVAKLCVRLGIAHDVLHWDGAAHRGNLQDGARRARQDLIGEWARARGLACVVTGHTRDDQAETVLLRLKRGSGVDGLSGMAERVVKDGVVWLRPVLRLRRAALRFVLVERGIEWADDPSNEDTRFDRVKMRKALEVLEETGISVDVLADTAARIGRAREALEVAVLALARECAEARNIGSVRLDLARLMAAPEELRLRLMAHALCWVSGAAYRPRLAALMALMADVADGQARTLLGCLVTPHKDGHIEVSREVAAVTPSDAKTCVFDGRWACAPAEGQWDVLGESGLAQFSDWRETAQSRNSLLSSPALWYNNELKWAPFMDKTLACKCWLRDGPQSFFGTILTH